MTVQTMRRGALMERVMAALRCVDAVGLEIDQVAQAVGRDYDTIKATLTRMHRLGMVWRVTLHHFAAYFSTAAARDAARAGIEEWHEATRVQRSLAAKKLRRVRYGLSPDAAPRPEEQSCTEFLSGYLKRMLPNPVSIAQGVEASGKTPCSVKRSFARLLQQGRAWSISRSGFARYFGSQEARDAAAAGQLEPVKKPAPTKPRRGRRTAPEPQPYLPVRGGVSRQPKTPRQPCQIIGMETAPRIVCPPCQVDRFRVDGPVVGGFYSDWLTKRGLG